MRSTKAQPNLLSCSSPLGSQKRFLPPLLMDTLVCMPLQGWQEASGEAHVGGDLAANQFVKLNLIGGGDDFAVAVVDFELGWRDFWMVLFVLEAHGALHFGGGVNESAKRIAWQRVVIATGIDVLEFSGFVKAALRIGTFEEEPFNLVGRVQRVAFLLVEGFGIAL